MAEEKLILWGEKNYYSPYVFSCFVALAEKGLPFEVRTFDLSAGEHRQGDYGARSITGRVPSLQHGELWLAESSAIDEYLEEVFPPPRYARLYPARPAERARARQVQAWVRSDLMPLREERPTSSVFMKEPVKPLSAAGRAAAERVVRAAEALLPAGATWLFGDFGVADADLGLMLQRLVANGDPVPDRLRDYAHRVWDRPSVKDWRARVPKGR
ncbi:glutathione transferase [Anaeromyxobacter diazotrophicus]|uniref:Glutathione S-transferase n=1 Tax=Anaeromyxobacter diazotrophicus TaxID=2590199 RepID=A0A7I9VHP8_9BACT|nr:glutathione transferase [Anaeromyxobacter diazotrophicus]GEJ55865.1 glutathione S-transferase [Anaeromyxobacter diazotrophicus]